MLSKHKPNRKRTNAPRNSSSTKQFLKDWARLAESGRQDLSVAKEGMLLLVANDGPMPPEWLDHQLIGDRKNFREFHAKGDLLIIYRDVGNTLTFTRIGTHSDLF